MSYCQCQNFIKFNHFWKKTRQIEVYLSIYFKQTKLIYRLVKKKNDDNEEEKSTAQDSRKATAKLISCTAKKEAFRGRTKS